MTTLYLIRHARSLWNAEGRMQGWADVALDDIGRQQAQALAERFRHTHFDVIYTSPLSRARDTAAALAAPHLLPLQFDERLKERHLGEWTGLTGDEANARYPEQWKSKWHTTGAPGGETQDQLMERAGQVFADLLTAHHNQHIVAVSHGGLLNAYLCHLLGLPADDRVVFGFPNTGLTHLHFNERRVRVITTGDCAHLPPELRQ